MKEIYIEKEDAVSPVIATILMVAITVVLAATVYILVSHYTSVGATTPLAGSLAVNSEGSGSSVYYYNLTLTYSTPANMTNLNNFHLLVSSSGATFKFGSLLGFSTLSTSALSKLTSQVSGSVPAYVIVNPNGELVGSTNNNYIGSGAIIVLVSSSALPSGTSISVTYSGYSGTVSTTLP